MPARTGKSQAMSANSEAEPKSKTPLGIAGLYCGLGALALGLLLMATGFG